MTLSSEHYQLPTHPATMSRYSNWYSDDLDFYDPWTSRILDSTFGRSFHPREFRSARILPRIFRTPSGYSRNWTLSEKTSTEGSNGASAAGDSVTNTEKDGFQVCLDVQQFTPSEINVKVVENFIVVEGKHEERADDLGLISRQFTRRYALPKGYNMNDVVSTLSSDGVLTIKAPPLNKVPEIKEKVVPIQITGPAHGADAKPEVAKE